MIPKATFWKYYKCSQVFEPIACVKGFSGMDESWASVDRNGLNSQGGNFARGGRNFGQVSVTLSGESKSISSLTQLDEMTFIVSFSNQKPAVIDGNIVLSKNHSWYVVRGLLIGKSLNVEIRRNMDITLNFQVLNSRIEHKSTRPFKDGRTFIGGSTWL